MRLPTASRCSSGNDPSACTSQARQRRATSSFLLTLALVQQSNAIAPLARAVCDRFAGREDAPYAILPVDLGIVVEPFGLLTRTNAILTPVARRLAGMIAAGGTDPLD